MGNEVIFKVEKVNSHHPRIENVIADSSPEREEVIKERVNFKGDVCPGKYDGHEDNDGSECTQQDSYE